MCSLALAIEHHEGRSLVEHHYRELLTVMGKYKLSWKNIVAIVTDTEPTMNSFGRIVEKEAASAGFRDIEHIGCIDHILNTITKKHPKTLLILFF